MHMRSANCSIRNAPAGRSALSVSERYQNGSFSWITGDHECFMYRPSSARRKHTAPLSVVVLQITPLKGTLGEVPEGVGQNEGAFRRPIHHHAAVQRIDNANEFGLER